MRPSHRHSLLLLLMEGSWWVGGKQGSCAAAAAAAAAAARSVGVGSVDEAGDAHAPGVGARLQVVPGEGTGQLGLELVVQRPRVVIVHELHCLAAAQPAERREDERMS